VFYLSVLGYTLRLEPGVFQAMQLSPDGLKLALFTVLLAGFSSQLGQSVILFVNRIRPPRFFFALLVGMSFYLLNVFIWALGCWLLGLSLFGREVGFVQVLTVIGLAQAPQLLAFFMFVPFFGVGLGWLLSLWSLLATLTGLQTVLDVSIGLALFPAGGSWLVLQLFQRTVGQPLTLLAQRVRSRVAGVEALQETIDAPALIEKIEKNTTQRML
jgi:hypothetical protein